MKLTKIKGLAHDLANHLDFQIWFGYYKDLQKDVITDVVKNKDSFDSMCIDFFKERLPKSFDFTRIKRILIEIHRTMTELNITIKINVDDKEISYDHKSKMI